MIQVAISTGKIRTISMATERVSRIAQRQPCSIFLLLLKDLYHNAFQALMYLPKYAHYSAIQLQKLDIQRAELFAMANIYRRTARSVVAR